MMANLGILYKKARQRIDEKGLVRGISQGISRRLVEPKRKFIYALAFFYRQTILRHVVFVGITGSCGKTSTKELAYAVISARYPTKSNIRGRNVPHHLVSMMLQIRPWHSHAVVEMGAGVDDRFLSRSLRLVGPKIGIVTMVGTDHLSTFGSVEAIAREKSKLVHILPRDGTAILNADDPRVIAMADLHDGRVITYGTVPEAMVRGSDARSAWPDRLSLDVTFERETRRVQTQLCGTHLVPSVLAALSAGIAVGVPLDEAIASIGTVPPFRRRMCPVDHPDGFTFICDEAKASPLTLYPALDFIAQAKAPQKVVVLGTISDFQGSSRVEYPKAARAALDIADHVVFVGPNASQSRGARDHERGDALRICITLDIARDYLAGIIQPEALVLLKGSGSDDLQELVSLRLRPAAHGTDGAGARSSLSDQAALEASQRESQRAGSAATAVPDNERMPVRVVVGLGNPGDSYRDSPHNVGHRIVDALAERLGAQWEDLDGSEVARAAYEEQELLLIKPRAWMNKSGPAVVALAERLGFTASETLLAHDDMDMPLGRVRAKLRGIDAGHRGLRSIFETLGTNEVRRIKLGVAPPPGEARSIERLTLPFTPGEQTVIDQAYPAAVDRLLKVIRTAKTGTGQPKSSRKKATRKGPPNETRNEASDKPSVAA